MSDYAKEHFQTEEALLLEHGFPGLEEHVREHDVFVARVMDMVFEPESAESGLEDVLAFLVEWLVAHISGTDKKYGPYLNERGVF